MPRRPPNDRDCARALWLLGLSPPVTADDLTAAYRARISQAHPDRHIASAARSEAANTLTRALNDARAIVSEWIGSGRSWPRTPATANGARPAQPPPRPASTPPPAPVCRRTGLRAGDLVRVWPYDGDARAVAGTIVAGRYAPAWVVLDDGSEVLSDRVRLAAFACPVCGICAGPAVEHPVLRPCPDCLVDLRRLERRAEEAARVRSAIEARAQAGMAAAGGLGDDRLADRARERRGWARRLRTADPDDLHAALLSAFTNAFDRWAA
ncbi:MAG TPA: J domain-containing protein [Gaiellales bacterium]|jgi:hypothetical protein